MSGVVDDPEIKYFMRELQHTPAGEAYRRAWGRMFKAAGNIKRLFASGENDGPLLHFNRRAYAEASREASVALDVLNRLHSWPEEAPSTRFDSGLFTYRPPLRVPPRSRKDP